MTAVQDGPTSIRVSWTPPSPLGDTSSYRIYYTRAGGSSDSVDVDGGNTNTHTLMGLTNGETYTISIVGTSSSSGAMLRSPLLVGDVALGNSKNHPMQCAWNQSPHATFIPSICLCVVGVSLLRLCALVMMAPPLFDMRLCSLSVPSAAVLDHPTIALSSESLAVFPVAQ